MRTQENRIVEVPLHDLPRDIRIWLSERVGFKQPTHFGIVRLFRNSSIAMELKQRVQAHKDLKALQIKSTVDT